MSALVVDASAAVEYVLRTADGRRFAGVLRAEDTVLHAPAVCDVEVGGALRRLVLGRKLTPAAGAAALRDHRDFRIKRHSHPLLLSRAFELRENFGFADALYVALAELFQAPLLTADRRLAHAVSEHSDVELLG